MFNKSFSLASLLFILLYRGLKNIAAVLGQFCAEVLYVLPLPLLKQFHQLGSSSHKNIIGDFCRHRIKTSNFFNFQSTSILSILCNRRQVVRVSIPKYSLEKQNWTIVFGIPFEGEKVVVF